MIIEKLPEVQQLSAKEKAILARELWAESGDVDVAVSGDESHAETIGKRWLEFLEDPSTSKPWEEVKKRMEQRIQDDKTR